MRQLVRAGTDGGVAFDLSRGLALPPPPFPEHRYSLEDERQEKIPGINARHTLFAKHVFGAECLL